MAPKPPSRETNELRDGASFDAVVAVGSTLLQPAIALAILAGALSRFLQLGRPYFWFDEGWTHFYVKHLFDWPEGSSLWAECTNLPYYFVLRGWTALFGWSEAGYRSMSAVAGILTIPVLAAVSGRLRGPRAAALCAWIVALHPLHVYYSREARAYGCWMLVLSLALWLLIRALEQPTWKRWMAWSACVSLGLFTHYFTILWAPATALAVTGRRAAAIARWRWLVAIVAAFTSFAPYALVAVLPFARGGGTTWIAREFDPTWVMPWTLWVFLPSAIYPSNLWGLSLRHADTFTRQPTWFVAMTGMIPLVLLLTLAVIAVSRRRRAPGADVAPGDLTNADVHQVRRHVVGGQVETTRTLARAEPRGSGRLMVGGSTLTPVMGHAALAGLTILPLIMAWLYSMMVRPIYLVGRYDVVAWPSATTWLVLLLIDLSSSLGRRGWWKAKVTTAIMLACSVASFLRLWEIPHQPAFPQARAAKLAALSGPRDLTISFSYDRGELIYYLERNSFQGRIVSFPTFLDHQIGWIDTVAELEPARRGAMESDADGVVAMVRDNLNAGGAVWLLVDRVDAYNTGARGPINRVLLGALARAGIVAEPVDERTMILRLRGPGGTRIPGR